MEIYSEVNLNRDALATGQQHVQYRSCSNRKHTIRSDITATQIPIKINSVLLTGKVLDIFCKEVFENFYIDNDPT